MGRLSASLRPLTLACAASAALLSGCDLAPLYHAPTMVLPDHYSGIGPFVRARPEAQLPRGPWWEVFGDTRLNQLEVALDQANPDLAAARESYQQARDLVGEARSGLFPQLNADAFASNNKQSYNTLFHTPGSGPQRETANGWGGSASWGPDFWDQVRNETRAAKSSAQASAADLASARLALELQLANDYLAVQGIDAQHGAYQAAIGEYSNAVKITQMRLDDKIGSGIDVERAKNQLAATVSADTETQAQRALLVHAIAVLVGRNPADFMLPPAEQNIAQVPTIPVGVPSSLLQRRPDIAAAERRMASANQEIGVARAAFYPNLRLSASGGFEDSGWALLSIPNELWAVGATAMMPLFEGGLRHAQEQRSWSQFAQTGDQYRSVVLNAFREVEDQLALTDHLAAESSQQHAALRSAQKVQDMAMTLYREGIDNYLNVTVAQTATLAAQIATVQIETRRLQASVGLIGALGGGWQVSDLPAPDKTVPPMFATHEDTGAAAEPVAPASSVSGQ